VASVLESAILDSTAGVLRPNDLALHLPREAAQQALPNSSRAPIELPDNLTRDAAVRRHFQQVLDLNRGNKFRAARELSISRSTLYRLPSGASIAPETNLPS
jgi:transcriptional regulator of acetoin/glycerol metabolism